MVDLDTSVHSKDEAHHYIIDFNGSPVAYFNEDQMEMISKNPNR
jgi:hypothetical protein